MGDRAAILVRIVTSLVLCIASLVLSVKVSAEDCDALVRREKKAIAEVNALVNASDAEKRCSPKQISLLKKIIPIMENLSVTFGPDKCPELYVPAGTAHTKKAIQINKAQLAQCEAEAAKAKATPDVTKCKITSVKRLSDRCDQETDGLYNTWMVCGKDTIVEYLDPGTRQWATVAVGQKPTRLETCTGGVTQFRARP